MGDEPNKAADTGLVLNLELAKTLFKWISTLIGILGGVVAGANFMQKDAGEHVNHTAEDAQRIQRLENERDAQQRVIVELTGNLRACQQRVEDQDKFYLVTTSHH